MKGDDWLIRVCLIECMAKEEEGGEKKWKSRGTVCKLFSTKILLSIRECRKVLPQLTTAGATSVVFLT